MTDTYATDGAFALRVARETGVRLLEVRRTSGLSGTHLGLEADRVAQRWIADALAREHPVDAVLSEEDASRPGRIGASRVWIVDPLDGTWEYLQGRDDWAVHVALAVDGVPVAGAVDLPAIGRHFSTDRPVALAPRSTGRLRMVVSRSRAPAFAEAVARDLDAEVVPMGSAGAKAMAVLHGAAEIYLHAGGQHEWDSCAPVAVVLASGLHASRIDGTPLLYNRPDPYVADLVVCRSELRDAVLASVAKRKSGATA